MEYINMRFDKNSPLYQQLYLRLAEDIRAGRIKAGEKLPSKRNTAAQLQISVNTVDTAYQMLVAEGYLQSKQRSGYTVCKLEKLFSYEQSKKNIAQSKNEKSEKPKIKFDFQTASIDTTLFPFKAWRRIQRDLLAGNPSLLNHGNSHGDENLRKAIATHLREFRGASCCKEQIIVGAGIEYLLGILARLFSSATFAVENPGYSRTHCILQNSGAKVEFIAVDEKGMMVNTLSESKAQLAYVTPSHQFPTGVTMPIGRRTELLQWAASGQNRYLIEDDYDSEFRFDGKPLPALQGLDTNGHVIYISTFSKSIAPAIRIGYMVLPTRLLQEYEEKFGMYSCTVSRFEQQTLCKFMEEGYFSRHLARLRTAYKQRRDALVMAIENEFGKKAEISGSHTGLHLLVTIKFNSKANFTNQKLVKLASESGIRLTALTNYYFDSNDLWQSANETFVLGYAALTTQQIPHAVKALKSAWAEYL